MRYNGRHTEHNMKSIGRAAVAQWSKRLTREKQFRVRVPIGQFLLVTLATSLKANESMRAMRQIKNFVINRYEAMRTLLS